MVSSHADNPTAKQFLHFVQDKIQPRRRKVKTTPLNWQNNAVELGEIRHSARFGRAAARNHSFFVCIPLTDCALI